MQLQPNSSQGDEQARYKGATDSEQTPTVARANTRSKTNSTDADISHVKQQVSSSDGGGQGAADFTSNAGGLSHAGFS